MSETKPYGIIVAVVIGISVFASMSVLSGAIVRSKDTEMIRVTGSARKPIRSDFIIWRGKVSFRAATVAAAYQSVREGTKTVTDYLRKRGVPQAEILSQAIQTKTLYVQVKRTNDGAPSDDGSETYRKIEGYELTQAIEVRSSNVDLVDKISREVTDLIANGVPFESEPPQYLYTKISEVKVEILAEAAKDARRRAEEIAKSSGAELGSVRFARMSPLQISPIYSSEVAADGQNDTTSLDKAITAIISMGFSVR